MTEYRSARLELGRIVGSRRILAMDEEARKTHLYIVGSTGTGKSKFLEHLIRQDIVAQGNGGPGLLLLDPHGSLYNNLARWMAEWDIKRPVLFFDPSRDDFVVPYNLLRPRQGTEPTVIVRNLLNAMAYVWGEDGTQATPLFNRMARNILLTLYLKGLTLNEAPFLTNQINAELREAMTKELPMPTVAQHWEFMNSISRRDFDEMISSTLNRLESFNCQQRLTRIFGHPDRSLDLLAALEEGHIILVNLATESGKIDDEDARLLGTVLLADLWATAKQRGKRAGGEVANLRPFHVYLDEFQNFMTPTIAKNLAEARGFGLRLTLAHQFPSQLTKGNKEHGELLLNSILTNARSKVVFGGIGAEEDIGPLVDILYRGVLDPDEVKHRLYSTKVLDYKIEYHKVITRGTSHSDGGGSSSGSGSGSGMSSSTGRSESSTYDADGNLVSSAYSSPSIEAFNSFMSETYGQSESWADTTSESVSEAPMLTPILGEELSSVQFRDLEEQRYRALAALFDQEQRQCIVRLVGMKEPVSIFTPFVKDPQVSGQTAEDYITRSYEQWDRLVLAAAEAIRRVEARRIEIELKLLEQPLQIIQEPDHYKRPVTD